MIFHIFQSSFLHQGKSWAETWPTCTGIEVQNTYVQQALFAILLDDNSTAVQYDEVANVIWNAVLDGQKIRKTTAIALLYYRLGNINAPYENNTIWSIASNLLDLDYANSEYNPLKDEKIIKKLTFYGLSV